MNILIADDHDIFRQSLALLLENRSAHRVVGQAASFVGLAECVLGVKPDCILMDYHMPGGDPIQAAEAIRRATTGIKIIMLTGAQSGAILKQLDHPLFEGVLHKRDDAETILKAIELIDQGQRFISPAVAGMITTVAVELTHRETQVLSLFMRGLAPPSIADTLNISSRTVEKHKENMMKKMGVSNAVQMVEMGHKILLEE